MKILWLYKEWKTALHGENYVVSWSMTSFRHSDGLASSSTGTVSYVCDIM